MLFRSDVVILLESLIISLVLVQVHPIPQEDTITLLVQMLDNLILLVPTITSLEHMQEIATPQEAPITSLVYVQVMLTPLE